VFLRPAKLRAVCSLLEGRHKLFIKRTVFLSRTVVRTRSQRCKQPLSLRCNCNTFKEQKFNKLQ